MSNDFILCMKTVLEQGFKLLTCFKLPGVNFSPAVMIFGILSFGLAIILIKGIISVSAEGINYTAYQQNMTARSLRSGQRGKAYDGKSGGRSFARKGSY